ncbi:hypothetical protein [uncultured Cellulomonas sp.]|uniref:hypothetical protein n=1 Tax=uncultured Cellulomonas sp. TaxID=189682 RepID=UPI00262A1112|nr:hypothetical protein [uncultured Cellulomonas sp.]
MKGYTSRERFDEARRFVAVQEEMGRARLDADGNEHARLRLTDSRRRSADLAEGSPDDGFRVTDTFVLDAITSTAGWRGSGLAPGDERVIPPELRLERRDPETLPHVVRVRGHVTVRRVLPDPVDLLAVPPPGPGPAGLASSGRPPAAPWSAAELRVRLRIARVAADDEVALTRLEVRDADGTWHPVLDVPAEHRDGVLRVPASSLAPLERGAGPDRTLVLTGWGVTGLPPRAETDLDALEATDAALGGDVVLRGGGGTPATAGRLYVDGRRAFIESDWRYSTQPFLPSPPPLAEPDVGASVTHVLEADIWDREVHSWQDPFLREPALDGDPTTFRRQQVVQVRAREVDPAAPPTPATPVSEGRLSSDVPDGVLPDRTPPEEPDRCRERCLSTASATTGTGYTGSTNAHLRFEVLGIAGTDARAVLWSRDNAALAAPLTADVPANGLTLSVGSFHAARFRAGDVVTLEEEAARLDPGDPRHHPVLRRLRSVDTATGRLELEPEGHVLSTDPAPLDAGGGPGRVLRTADVAAVRRWDGADWLVTGVRYRLVDNITFAFSGTGHRPGEHWQLTARVVAPDGDAQGVLERRTDAPPDGPWHSRVPVGLVRATRESAAEPVRRTFTDLRVRFLPLTEVRDRLVELGARHLAPGAFTVVVGDGTRTFGHIDQDLAEGVTGDEAVHAALAELAGRPGTIYLRAGTYVLEHPVVLQGVSGVRILGDGAATRLEVRGAGGAFVLDRCGTTAPVVLELLDLVEVPGAEVPIGGEPVDGGGLVGDLVPLDDGGGALTPADVVAPAGGLAALLDTLRDRVRSLRPGEGRAFASLVATVLELRRLQRTHPGRPLEDVAPDQLRTLRRLPHGVVSVGDSRDVRLRDLRITSTDRAGGGSGVLLTGTLTEVEVAGCAVRAPSGVVATALAPALAPGALVLRPRAGLFLHGLRVTGNDLRARDAGAGTGVLVTEGSLDGVVLRDNDVAGFATGVRVLDEAVARHGERLDRTTVADNRVVDVTAVGIDVVADVVDVERNQVRLAPAAAPVRVGIRVAGSRARVDGCVVDLPPTAPDQSPLGLEAGVVVGTGADVDDVLDRPVSDVTVAGTRVTGAGAATAAHGIVIGGSAPVLDVTVTGCEVRHVGGSGVRGLGHAGAVGRLRVLGCTVEDVATAALDWSPALQRAAQEHVPAATGRTPRTLLESVLAAQGRGVPPALDGLLRWLEAATLRAGIGLSLVDDVLVADNRVRGVGRPDLPADVPGADVHVAGIAALGGEDHRIRDNDVRDVHGAVRRLVPVPLPVPVRPGLLDVLDALPSSAARPAGDLYEALVGLRSLAHTYAVSRGRAREQVGRRVYTAMEAVSTELAERGGQSARLGHQLDGAVEEMREAQGDADHTAAANLVRVAVSRAAELTAPDDDTAAVWGLAAQLDGAMTRDRAALVAAAGDVSGAAARLLDGLALDVDLAGDARAVIAADAGSAAEERAALTLAGDLGTVASARRLTRSTGATVLTPTQQKLMSSVLGAVRAEVERPASGAVTPDVVAGLADGVDSLVRVLDQANAPLATTVRQRYERLRRTRTAPDASDVDALRESLGRVQAFVADPAQGASVGAAEVAADQEQAHGQLVMLTAGWVDRTLAGLADRDEAAETRSLRLLTGNLTQLSRLVGDHPDLVGHVQRVRDAVRAAADQPRDRERHKADAAQGLATLRAEQARAVNAATPVATEVGASQVTDRLAALTQLAVGLRTTAPGDDRDAAVGALGTHLRSVLATEIDLPEGDRRRLLEAATSGVTELTGRSGTTRAVGLHRVGSVLAEVAAHAADQAGSVAADAVATLAGALPLALQPDRTEQERLDAAVSRIRAAQASLSPSSARALAGSTDLRTLLDRVELDLSVLTRVPRPWPRPQPPDRVVAPLPADGVVAAGVDGSVTVGANAVAAGRRGIVVGGAALHPLAPLAPLDPDGAGAPDVVVVDNTVRGAVVAGISVDAGTVAARVRVDGNDLQGCAGAATEPTDAPPPGRAVLEVRGRGRLALRGNRLDGNGSGAHPGVLHAIAVRFDGDVTADGNRVRHSGGQLGGAGLVTVQAAVPDGGGPSDGRSWDFTDLTTRPFLEVDPPPRRPRPTLPPVLWPLRPEITALIGPVRTQDVVASGAPQGLAGAPGASLEPGVAAATFAAVRPPALSVLTAPAPTLAHPLVADALAARWLEPPPAAVVGHHPDLRPVLDFLVRPRPWLVPLPPRPVRVTLQLCDNDVVARGPAVLALGSARVLLGTTVTGNTLVSTGTTGAAYLRDVDSCVVGSNRLECAAAVTVLLVRALDSLVAVTGNVLAGREPPTTTTVPPRPMPLPVPMPTRPPVRLDLDLGQELGGSVSIALDPARVLAALRDRTDTVATGAAQAAAADFDVFARRNQIVTDPAAAFVLETASRHQLLDVDLSKAVVRTQLDKLGGIAVTLPGLTRGGRLAGGALGRPLRAAARAATAEGAAAGTAADAAAGAAAGAAAAERAATAGRATTAEGRATTAEGAQAQGADGAGEEPAPDLTVSLTRLTEDFGRILDEGGLSPTAKLFGIAKSSGLPETAARAMVSEHLVRNNGDADAALRSGLGVLTGVSAPPAAPAPGRASAVPLLESVLGSVLEQAAVEVSPGRLGVPHPFPTSPTFPGRPTLPTGPVGPTLPGTFPPVRPPVPPRPPTQHTLVVIGGAQVAVTGNATTAGADVRPAEPAG